MTKGKAIGVLVAILLFFAGVGTFGVITLLGQVSQLRTVGTAVCSLRHDLQTRHDAGVRYLVAHPRGVAGISAATIEQSLQNEQSTLNSLKPLRCN